ncbi:ABC transporter substrate-binding protein [Pseudonocardia sp. TRM90224]|uniref:ABC transporter substrate-binding protein n=1 Tax=Pseudonocardia sp. TRM90224 TaxID=2812678 RepID=UPI001E3DACBA|nr:ABC transporter substrate-binding protein [Pseudonocardia sp. TRM90224]
MTLPALSFAVVLASASCGFEGADPGAAGSIVVSTDHVPSSLNPGLDASGSQLDLNFLETAVTTTINSDGAVVTVPMLATSWKQVDGDTWSFDVRPNVTFSNGEALTAGAFEYSLELAKKESLQTGPILADYTITVVDELTFEVSNTKAADAVLPDQMNWLYVYPPKYTEEVGFNAFGTKPVGTGPYEVSMFQGDTSVSLTANDTYWNGKPTIEKVTVNTVADAATRVGTLLSGDAQVVLPIPTGQEGRVEGDTKLKLTSSPSSTSDYLQLNVAQPPFDDPRVAEAASLAIDRKALITGILNGDAHPYNGLVYPSMLDGAGAQLQRPIDPDVTRAKALMREAGSAAQTPFTLFTAQDIPQGSLLAQAIATQLESIGLKPQVRSFENSGQYFDAWASGKEKGIALGQNLLPWPAPDILFQGFFSPGTLFSPLGSWPEAKTLADRARGEADPATRIALFKDLQDLILGQHHAWIPLFILDTTYASSTSVEFPPVAALYGTFAGLRLK